MVKIVLTGGPCGGKSSAREHLTKLLEERGYKVLFVPEAATELILGGVSPVESGISNLDFQRLMMKCQTANEELFEDASKKLGEKVVIFCDRGLCDQMAYMEKDDFLQMMSGEGESLSSVYARYDAVLHLCSAAVGAEEHYQYNDGVSCTGNNVARRETPEMARAIDKKTMESWIGHPHLRVIENRGTFAEKIDECVEEVFGILGEPVPREIERKFLVKKPTSEQVRALGAVCKTNIVQTYLKSEEGVERRVRQRGTKQDGFSFYYTEKRDVSYGVREEVERKISKEEYIELLAEADTSLHQISKVRSCFVYDGKYFELDEYPFSDDYAILEIELQSIEEGFTAPPLVFVEDVTGNNAYKNSTLAKTQRFEVERNEEHEMEF